MPAEGNYNACRLQLSRFCSSTLARPATMLSGCLLVAIMPSLLGCSIRTAVANGHVELTYGYSHIERKLQAVTLLMSLQCSCRMHQQQLGDTAQACILTNMHSLSEARCHSTLLSSQMMPISPSPFCCISFESMRIHGQCSLSSIAGRPRMHLLEQLNGGNYAQHA